MKNKFEGLGLEAIHFQKNGALHAAMTAHMDIVRGTSTVEAMHHVLSDVKKTILKLTGMTIDVVTHDSPEHDNMFVMMEQMTLTHPLMCKLAAVQIATGEAQYKPLDIAKVLQGGVDLKTGMVYGSYSKIGATVYISVDFLNNPVLSSASLSAFFIHELGHIHTYFEFLGQTFITNYMLHESSRIWLGNYPKVKRIELLNGIEKQSNVKINNKEQLAENDDPTIVHAVINNMTVNKVRSEMGTAFYDRRNVEFLSDQFAVRHGAARDLIIAQDTYYRGRPWLIRDEAFRSTSSMVILNLIKVSMLLTANTPALLGVRALAVKGLGAAGAVKAGLGATIISTTLISAPALATDVIAGAGFTWLMGLLGDKGHNLYDKPADRFAAIRNDLLSALKIKGQDKHFVDRVLEDLKVIDDAIAKLNGLGNLEKMLYDYIIGAVSGRGDEVKMQQQYEKLSNNNLFQHAAKLSTLDATK